MKLLVLKLGILVLTFTIGLLVNAQILRFAYYWIPDVDPQPKSAPLSSEESLAGK